MAESPGPEKAARPAPPPLALVGPTASGKTAAALAIAKHFAPHRAVEIISVDSALVYRGMDIGTAKPGPEERAQALHHLIDIRDPAQTYSAAEFAQDAGRLIGEIQARGHLPLLVGGTLLYLKALVDGLDPMPAADPTVRAAIDTEARTLGWPALHAELARVDPLTAARLAPADAQRIQRALEVFRVSGRPLSDFHRDRRQRAAGDPTVSPSGASTTAGIGIEDLRVISLEPSERAWLHARIAERFDAMLAGGLMEEVRSLRARGDLNPDLPSMRCVGYRQAWDVLDGRHPATALRDLGIFATRQLAKRQLTWLRGMPRRRVVACDRPEAVAQVLALARGCWESA